MYNFIWNLSQEQRLNGLNSATRGIQNQAERARQDVRDNDSRIDRLALVCEAMWSLIQECTDLTEKDLAQRVTDLDLKDGQLDGKFVKDIVNCDECGAAISHKYQRCLFCGQAYDTGTAFAKV